MGGSVAFGGGVVGGRWRWRWRWRQEHTPYTEDFQAADSLRPGTEGPGPASERRARRGPPSPFIETDFFSKCSVTLNVYTYPCSMLIRDGNGRGNLLTTIRRDYISLRFFILMVAPRYIHDSTGVIVNLVTAVRS